MGGGKPAILFVERNSWVSKFSSSGIECIFLGYEEGHHSYRVWDPVADKIHISHHVSFKPNVFPYQQIKSLLFSPSPDSHLSSPSPFSSVSSLSLFPSPSLSSPSLSSPTNDPNNLDSDWASLSAPITTPPSPQSPSPPPPTITLTAADVGDTTLSPSTLDGPLVTPNKSSEHSSPPPQQKGYAYVPH